MSGDEPVVPRSSAAQADAALADGPAAAEQVRTGDTIRVPLAQETARIDKRAVESGRVRVSTRTEVSEQVLRETLRGNAVGVTRVPVNRTLSEGEAAPVARVEGGVTVIPVLEEILVVEKRLVLREEVHIRKTQTGEAVEVPVTLRRQRAVVERVSPEGHVTEQPEPSTEDTPS